MSPDSETIRSAAAAAVAAPLDLPGESAGVASARGDLSRLWWPDYAGWLAERCGEEKAAPAEPGGGGLVPICDAPGTYVYDH